jgi:hypothetical protein
MVIGIETVMPACPESFFISGVIPAQAGIQVGRKMDARLKISGMTGKEKSVNTLM